MPAQAVVLAGGVTVREDQLWFQRLKLIPSSDTSLYSKKPPRRQYIVEDPCVRCDERFEHDIRRGRTMCKACQTEMFRLLRKERNEARATGPLVCQDCGGIFTALTTRARFCPTCKARRHAKNGSGPNSTWRTERLGGAA